MSALHVPHRAIRAVLFDAMFTLLQPIGRSRRKMLTAVYRQPDPRGEILLPPSQYTDERIWETLRECRRQLSPLQTFSMYWRFANTEFYRAMFRPDAPENTGLASATWQRYHHAMHYGEQATDRILTDVSRWMVQPSMRQLLQKLGARRVRRVIASNQRQEALLSHLHHHALVGTMQGDLVDAPYTSELLGTNKPYPEFWERILAREGLEPADVIHIGNSPVSDVGACELGIHVILYDLEGELDRVTEGDFSQVALPAEREALLRKYLAEGLVTVVHNVPELRDVLLPILNVERIR